MNDFETKRFLCEENKKISARVIDSFLLNYAEVHDHLEFQMNNRFEVFRHITDKFPQEWKKMFQGQYIAHRIFKEDGLITDYLRHTALLDLDKKARIYLEIQAKKAWRFSFSVIKYSPADNFFIMRDVFSTEEFLLYSPGVTKILEEQSISLWLNLISFNSICWQSYGPIGAYRSFEPDDILFFGRKATDEIVTKEELIDDLEYNPVPYMMLLAGANSPFIFSKEDQLVHVMAEYYPESFSIRDVSGLIKTEYSKGIYRLSLKYWSEPPHCAFVYYDEDNKILRFNSLTERGYRAFLEAINKFGYDFPEDMFMRVNISMMSLATDMLRMETGINEYEDLFRK